MTKVKKLNKLVLRNKCTLTDCTKTQYFDKILFALSFVAIFVPLSSQKPFIFCFLLNAVIVHRDNKNRMPDFNAFCIDYTISLL